MPNYLTIEENRLRQRRAQHLYLASALAAGVVGLVLLWALRGLILPVTIGMVMAYLFLPLVAYLKNKGLSRSAAIFSLFVIFCLLLFSALSLAGNLIPDKKTELELQIRARYKLNEKFLAIMGLDTEGRGGNWLFRVAGQDLLPLRNSIDEILALSVEDQRLFVSFYQFHAEAPEGATTSGKYWRYYQENMARDRATQQRTLENKGERAGSNGPFGWAEKKHHGSLLRTIFKAASLWLVTPLVFLTLLFDGNRLLRGLIHNVPNRYFEPTITVIDSVNAALGRYLRGTATECLLVGICFAFCLVLIGFDLRWAVIIGAISGLANAIPFLGTAIGLALGIFYAIMAEEIQPILPFINDTNLAVAVAASVIIVHLADNAFFQPYVLGGAVDLPPMAIILGVMSGALLFGFAGLLFAIPTIIIAKVVATTTFHQLRAYHII